MSCYVFYIINIMNIKAFVQYFLFWNTDTLKQGLLQALVYLHTFT